MEKKITHTFTVENDDGQREFEVLVKKGAKSTKYELYASKNSVWADHMKGTLLMKISDTGDGLKLDKKYDFLDYCAAIHLKILLTINHSLESHPEVYTAIPINDRYNAIELR